MGEQENIFILKKRFGNPRDGIGTQRMTLKEFNARVQGYIDAIATTQKILKTINFSFTSEHRIKRSDYRSLIGCVIEIDENCNKLLESIECSTYLPLSVVPFLLPLLTTLKTVKTQVIFLKQLLDKEFETSRKNYGLATERQQEVQCELEALNLLCEKTMNQVRFLLHQARFQTSSLLQSSLNY